MSDDAILILSRSQACVDVCAIPPGHRVIMLEVAEGLGGVYTDIRSGVECLRFGHPRNPRSRQFRYYKVDPARHSTLTLAIERMIYARGIRTIGVLEGCLEPPARRGVAFYGALVKVVVREAGEAPPDFIGRLLKEEAHSHD